MDHAQSAGAACLSRQARHFEQLPRHESGDVGLAVVPDQLLQARTQVAPCADAGAIQALYGLPAASGKPHAEELVVVGAGGLQVLSSFELKTATRNSKLHSSRHACSGPILSGCTKTGEGCVADLPRNFSELKQP